MDRQFTQRKVFPKHRCLTLSTAEYQPGTSNPQIVVVFHLPDEGINALKYPGLSWTEQAALYPLLSAGR